MVDRFAGHFGGQKDQLAYQGILGNFGETQVVQPPIPAVPREIHCLRLITGGQPASSFIRRRDGSCCIYQ